MFLLSTLDSMLRTKFCEGVQLVPDTADSARPFSWMMSLLVVNPLGSLLCSEENLF